MTDLKKTEFKEDSPPYSFFAEQAIINIFLTNARNKNLLTNNLTSLKKKKFLL